MNRFRVGSQALGSFGVSVRSDTAQVYQDHGPAPVARRPRGSSLVAEVE